MERTRKKRREWPSMLGMGVFAPMVDVFLLGFMVILMHKPMYGLVSKQYPPVKEEKKQEGDGPTMGHVVRLDAEGKFFWDEKPIEVEPLVERIVKETKPEEKVRFTPETGGSGQGNLSAFLRLQTLASTRGVWDRLAIIHKKQTNKEQP